MSPRSNWLHIGLGIAVLLLALLAARHAGQPRAGGSPANGSPRERTASRPSPPLRDQSPRIEIAFSESDPSEPVVSREEERVVLDGFIVRSESGRLILHCQDEVLCSQNGEPLILLSTESALRFASLNLGGPGFRRWIEGHGRADQAPRVWVRVWAIRREEVEDESASGGDFGRTVLHIEEVLQVDHLSEEWIAYFQLVVASLETLRTLPDQPLSADRRERFHRAVETTDRLLHELSRLRGGARLPEPLRGFRHVPEFERRTERALGLRLRELSEPYGLTPRDAPSAPPESDLRQQFLGAGDQADLLRTLVSLYGEEVLEDELLYFEGDERSGRGVSVRLRVVLEVWSPAEFCAVRDRARALSYNHRPELQFVVHSDGSREEILRRAGLEVREIGDAERQVLLIKEGALVVRVDFASRAERAGLRVGDIIWKVTAPTSKRETSPDSGTYVQDGPLGQRTVRDAGSLGFELGWCEGLETMSMEVIRAGRVETLLLAVR